MSVELESWCQQKLTELLHQKEELMKRKDNSEDADYSYNNLPHYNSMLESYKAMDKQEMILLEINHKIQSLERENEIKNFKKAFSCMRIVQDQMEENNEESYVREWMKQMVKCNTVIENNDIAADSECSDADVLFYDVIFDEETNSNGKLEEKLTWSTKYKGYCTRISVASHEQCRSCNEEDYKFSASFYVDGLVVQGKQYIATGRKVDEYVRDVVWAGLQKLIDIS